MTALADLIDGYDSGDIENGDGCGCVIRIEQPNGEQHEIDSVCYDPSNDECVSDMRRRFRRSKKETIEIEVGPGMMTHDDE